MKLTKKLATAALLVFALVVVGVTWAVAQDNHTVYACVNSKNGKIKIVAPEDTCKQDETRLTWNTVGPPGDTGATGPSGPSGPQGETGPAAVQDVKVVVEGIPGATGPSGPSGQSGPQGQQGGEGPAGPSGPSGPRGPRGPSGPPPSVLFYPCTIEGTAVFEFSGTQVILATLPAGYTGAAGMLTSVDYHFDVGADHHLRYLGVYLWAEVDANNQVVCHAIGGFADKNLDDNVGYKVTGVVAVY